MSDDTSDTSNKSNKSKSITIQLTITAAPGTPRVPLTVDAEATTPTALRSAAAAATKISLSKLKLIFRGRLIVANDDAKVNAVAEYKLEQDSVLHCMGKPESASDTAAKTVPGTAGTAGASTGASTGVPTVSIPARTASTAPTATPTAATAAATDPLTASLETLRTSNPANVYATALSTLDKLLRNIIDHPLETKYRSLKVQNPAMQRRLGGVPGGDAAMRACGFQVEMVGEHETYTMVASPEAWPALLAVQTKVAAALVQANVAAATNTLHNASNNSNNNGSLPNFMPPPGGRNIPPGMEQAVQQMLSNPQQLQAMLQDPMVQTMMRNDPRYANNPILRNALTNIANNPAAVQQLSQIMNDPAAMQQMQQLMQGNMGGLGDASGNMFGTPAAPSTVNNNNNNASNGGSGSDSVQTEEEMIAEAIRRSLQDSNNNNGSS